VRQPTNGRDVALQGQLDEMLQEGLDTELVDLEDSSDSDLEGEDAMVASTAAASAVAAPPGDLSQWLDAWSPAKHSASHKFLVTLYNAAAPQRSFVLDFAIADFMRLRPGVTGLAAWLSDGVINSASAALMVRTRTPTVVAGHSECALCDQL
jgi:hypothetical protein